MRRRRVLFVAAIAAFVPALLFIPFSANALQESATIFYEDTKTKDILRRAIQDEEQGRWKEAIGRYLQALDKYPNENHPIVEEEGKETISFAEAKGAGRRMGVREFIFRRLKRMPPEALRIYRDDLGFNAKAKREFEEGRKTGDLKRIEQAVERWFFASCADEALDYLANRHLEAGNADTAIQCWKRIVNAYPDSDIPAPVLLAKIARAAACHPSLSGEGKWASDTFQVTGNDAPIVIVNDAAGRASDAVRYTPVPSSNIASRGSGRRDPFIKMPEEIFFPEPRVARGDVQNWSESFFEQDGALPRDPNIRYYEGMVPGASDAKSPHSPYLPIAVIQDGKSYVVAQNGFSAVAVNPENGKRYWQEQFGKRPTLSGETRHFGGGVFLLKPVVFGCATDGKVVYLNQYSMQSRGATSPSGFYPSAIRAVNLRTGKLVWDSEEVNPRAAEEKDLALAMPPVVAGDRVFVASTTAPSGEQEVYVSAYDKRTGRLLWQTFVCSLYGTNIYRGYPSALRAPPTITVSGGVLYCQTNLGCIAAVNGASGHILWLTEYQRVSGAIRRSSDGEIQMRSGANWSMPVVFRNTLYTLPSDAEDLNAIHKETGKIIKDRFRNDANRKPWLSLNAVSDRYLAVSSTAETVVDLQNPETPMTLTGSPAVGKGLFLNNIFYVPTATGITMYTPGSWRIYGETAKWDPQIAGNIVVCGDHIVVQSSDGIRLTGYTSHDTILRSTAFKIRMEPVQAGPLLDYARKMMKSERFPDAIAGFERLLWLVDGVKDCEDSAIEAKDTLYTAYRRLGDKSRQEFVSGAAESGPKAVEMYASSKRYASGADRAVAATLSLARMLERTERFADAVAQYQELIDEFSGRFHPCDEKDGTIEENVRSFARRQIDALIRSRTPAVYAAVERKAAHRYATIPDGDRAGILALLGNYPNSAAAADAVALLDDRYRKEGRWNDRIDLLKYVDHNHPGLMDETLLQHELVLSLRMAKRWGEWSEELADLAARFGGKELRTPDGILKIDDIVRKERESAADPIPALKPLMNPLKAIAHLPTGSASLRPTGNRPSSLKPSVELMISAGGVELREPAAAQPLWRLVHPGAYSGIALQETTERLAVIGSISPSSPAAKAGLKRDDVIVAINGKPVDYRTGRALLAAAPVGVASHVEIRRSGKLSTVAMTPDPWPPSSQIPIVGAAWNRDEHLVIAWEDVAAGFRPETGALLWMAPASATDRKITAVAAADDGVLIAETLSVRPNIPEPVDRSRPTTTPIDYNRLLCVDSLSGEIRWIRSFPLTTETIRNGYGRSISTVATAGGRTALIVVPSAGARAGENANTALIVDVRTGEIRESRAMGQRFMIDIDRVHGRAAVVGYDRDAFNLACLSFNAETNGGKTGELWTRPLNLRLHNWWGEQDPPMMGINKETIAVIADPNVVRTFDIRDGGKEQTIALPDGRAIVPRSSACALSADGTLYVYNHLQADASNAFVTAINTREGKILWDGPAPANGGSYPVISVDHPNFVVLFAASGVLPGASGGYSPTCLIYSVEKQGYIVHEFQDLNVIQPFPSVRGAVWIGQRAIFVNTRKQLDVYGNE